MKFRLAVLFTLIAVAVVSGQESRASLGGVVTDTSQALIGGAAVKLTNISTGVALTTSTNSAGQYRFLYVNPGTYRLSVDQAGFRPFERSGILLQVGQAGAVDVVLQVGTHTEAITVTDTTPLLETERADRAAVVDSRRITDLPLNIRNPIMLIHLSPGVTHTGGQAHLNPFSNSGISQWSVNGSLDNNVEFLMDGAPNNTFSARRNRIAYTPTSDAVEEFRVMTSTYDAQYGRTGGGIVNVSTRSGGNRYRGSVSEYLQRSSMNANSFANNSKSLPRESTRFDQYGFTIGGPLSIPRLYRGRDRTFFFFSAEALGQNQQYPNEARTSVPTIAQKHGDFSQTFDNSNRLITIYDPLTGRMEGGAWVRSPFAGNVIPAGQINPTSAKIVELYPDPNTKTAGSTDWQNNYVRSPNTGRYDYQNYAARIDHNFSSRDRAYGRWMWNRHESLRIKNAIDGLGADHQTGGKTNNGIVVDWVSTLSSATLLNLRASLTRWQEDLPGFDHNFSPTQWGWPQSLVDQLPNKGRAGSRGYPTSILFLHRSTTRPVGGRPPVIEPDNYGDLGSTTFRFEPTNVFSLGPSLALIRGRHTFRAGLDFRLSRFTFQEPEYSAGQLEFDRAFTRRNYLSQDATSGNSIASLLLGYPSDGTVDYIAFPYYQTLYYAPWVQDDIRLTRRLTVNLGFRWDLNLPPTERFNMMNRGFLADEANPISGRIDQAKFPGFQVRGGIGFVGVNGMPRTPFDPDYNNIQPRIGAAYQVASKTVLRGGWGIFYVNPTSRGSNHGYSTSTPYVDSVDAGRTPANTVSNPFPDGIMRPSGAALGLETFLGQNITFSDEYTRVAYVHQFSFGIQRQLPFGVTVEASYVGSRTRSAPTTRGVNELTVEQLALGDVFKGGNPNYLNQSVPNPFAGLLPGTSYDGATVPRRQLLRPFPQFGSVTMADRPDGKTWYNSLQVGVNKQYSHGLSLTASYTLSKNIEAITYLNAQDAAPTRVLTDFDRPHRLNIAPTYELPFGPGRRFLNSTHPWVSRLAGGWRLVVTSIMQSGDPMSMPSSAWVLADPRLGNPTWDRMFKTGYIEANGITQRNVLPGEQPVFQIRPPNTLQTSPARYGNLRNQWGTTFDAGLLKSVRLREGMRAEFRVEAFNVFNTPIFASDPNQTPTNVNFGKLLRDNGQSNIPRVVQLGFRFEY